MRRATHFLPRYYRSTYHFYPRPPRGGRLERQGRCAFQWYFYPRPPRGGRPSAHLRASSSSSDFYPRPPRGGRLRPNEYNLCMLIFLSTPSARRATSCNPASISPTTNFYPRPPNRWQTGTISIHALREEGDCPVWKRSTAITSFLSTPSARRATFWMQCTEKQLANFYPRPPRGGRPCGPAAAHRPTGISIHALREEGDAMPTRTTLRSLRFLSTPSARRATVDPLQGQPVPIWKHFYPRPPRGGRPWP